MQPYVDVLSLSVTVTAAVAADTCVTYAGAPAGEDAAVFGVSHYDQAVGKEVACRVLGVAVLKATGAIGLGVRVMSSATAGAKAAGATPANPIGRALNAAADGEQVRVLLGR